MDITKLTRIKEAPTEGTYLIYTRSAVLFEDYSDISVVEDILKNNDILEVHLFDDSKEYRMLKSESKRFANGIIEHIVTSDEEKTEEDDNEHIDVYVDKTLIHNGSGRILNVYNRVAYNENGMAKIDDYRLAMGGRK